MEHTESKEYLMKYIKDAIQQESDVWIQTNVIADFESSSKSKKPRDIIRKECPSPQLQPLKKFPWIFLGVCIAIAAILFLIGKINGCHYNDRGYYVERGDFPNYDTYNQAWYGQYTFFDVLDGRKNYEDLSDYEKAEYDAYKTVNDNFRASAVPFYIIGIMAIAIGIIGGIAYTVIDNKSITKQNNLSLANYEENCKKEKETYSKNLSIYQRQMDDWKRQTAQARSTMDVALEKSQRILSQFYDEDLIYPKYRNLPALTSIYEYLVTGRCDELAGPHGAYNMYEDEVRKDMVISQLNTVIENLESIKQNQYMLYKQVNEITTQAYMINREIRNIRSYTQAITELTALNTYYTGLAARNSQITAAYHLLS